MTDGIILHGFHRSSASYRVRIALNLKGLGYGQRNYRLREGEQRDPAFLALNPQGLVPALEIAGTVLTQSLAICEYLDELHPMPPLLPADPQLRARVRAAAQVITCDIHPIQNLKILKRLGDFGLDKTARTQWACRTIEEGLSAFEALLPSNDLPFCFGTEPSLADLCLIPQLANAARFGVEPRWPRIERIQANCMVFDAFVAAAPDNQPDALTA